MLVLTHEGAEPQRGDDHEDVPVSEAVTGVGVGHGAPAVEGYHGDGEGGHQDVGP